jgi:hypothetical protein
LAEEYEGKITFIGVSNNDTVQNGQAYQDSFEVPYQLAHAPEVWAQFGDPVRPTTIVFDSEGEIFDKIIGPVDEATLRDILRRVS